MKHHGRPHFSGVFGHGPGRDGHPGHRFTAHRHHKQDGDQKDGDKESAQKDDVKGEAGPANANQKDSVKKGPGASAGRPDREKMRAEFIKRFDKDGDGKLSDEERAAARKQLSERRPGGQRPGGPGRAGRGPGGPDREKMRAEFMKRFDKDGDGKLSDEERATARKQFSERRGSRGGRDRSPGDAKSSDDKAKDSSDDKPDQDEQSSSDTPAGQSDVAATSSTSSSGAQEPNAD